MKSRSSFSLMRWLAVFFLLSAVILTTVQLIGYSRARANFPAGQTIANVPVGGLDRQAAAQRLLQVFSTPIEVHYNDAVIQIKPSNFGFNLNIESMLSAADQQRSSEPFWSGFWNALWNRTITPSNVPLIASYSEERLRTYLQDEIAARYDRDPSPAIPVAGSTSFQGGESGTQLDIDRAVELIDEALRSSTSRVVNLSYQKTNPPRPSLQNLQILLEQVMDNASYTGLAEMDIIDLGSDQELHFAYQQGQNPPVNIAFTAASTIKIPIMVSTFRHTDEPTPSDIKDLLTAMITESQNPPADDLMNTAIGGARGPLVVSEDMDSLGLENTFLAGFFYDGAPQLRVFQTPANTRTDINTSPDPYNQTTAADMAYLLEDIYHCAQNGNGTLPAAWGTEISQSECQQMITLLKGNNIPVLLQAGLPEGTAIAHKHGWTSEASGVIRTMGDSGIIFSPGGDYIFTIYLHDDVQLVFDPINQMVALMSQAVYNFFNQ